MTNPDLPTLVADRANDEPISNGTRSKTTQRRRSSLVAFESTDWNDTLTRDTVPNVVASSWGAPNAPAGYGRYHRCDLPQEVLQENDSQ